MLRERNYDHKCRSDSSASFCSSDERLSLDSEERKAVPLRKREIWFINMMNGNQGEVSMEAAYRPVLFHVARQDSASLTNTNRRSLRFHSTILYSGSCASSFARRKMKPGPCYSVLLLERARFIASFSCHSDSSFALYHFALQLSSTFAWFSNFRVRARGIARTFLGQHPTEVDSNDEWASYDDWNWFERCRISRTRPREKFSSWSLTNKTVHGYGG